jgi:hypothetical protein
MFGKVDAGRELIAGGESIDSTKLQMWEKQRLAE